MNEITTKQKILNEALRLFSAYGYDSVSVGQIARAVGIKAPSLYNHFGSKQEIFDALLDDSAKRYGSFTRALSVHVDDASLDGRLFESIGADALCEKVRQIFLYSLHDETVAPLRRMLTIEQFRSRQIAEMYTRRYVDRMVEYHSGIFRGLISAGVIKDEDPDSLALIYVSPILLLVGVCDREPEKEAECLEKLERHVRLFYGTYNIPKAERQPDMPC